MGSRSGDTALTEAMACSWLSAWHSPSAANHTIFQSVFPWHGMMIIFAFTGECEIHIQEHTCWKVLGELHCNGGGFQKCSFQVTSGPGSCPGSRTNCLSLSDSRDQHRPRYQKGARESGIIVHLLYAWQLARCSAALSHYTRLLPWLYASSWPELGPPAP